jgi:hypothetical protein
VEFCLTSAEYADLRAAADRSGLARGAYAAEASMAAARGTAGAADVPLREALRELVWASGQVRRIGINLNQAVARLHATGQRPGNLEPYAAECLRRAARLDAAAGQVCRALRPLARRRCGS